MRKDRVLRLLFIATIASLLAVLLVTYRSLERFDKEHQDIRKKHLSLRVLESVLSSIKELENALDRFQALPDTDALAGVRATERELDLNMETISTLMHLQGANQRVDTLRAIIDSAFVQVRQLSVPPLERGHRKRTEKKQADPRVDKALAFLHSTRDVHGRIVRAEDGELSRSNVQEERIGITTPLFLLAFAMLALLAVSLLFTRALRSMGKAAAAEHEIKQKVEQLDKEVRTREFAERSLKRVLDSSVSGIMAFRSIRDAEGRIIDFEWILTNHQAEIMLDRPADSLIGERMLEVLPATGTSGLFQQFTEVVTSRRAIRLDNVYDINGLGLHLDVHGVKLGDGLVVTYTDVSDRERQRSILRESERLALTGKIARTIAHEVRNPLTNVLLALDQIKEEAGGSEAILPYAEIVQRNVDRIAQLITEMLDSSRPRESVRKPCEIGTVVSDAVDVVRDRLELQHMGLALDIAPDLYLVEVDRNEIQLALSNIIINAIEAMEPGRGRLAIAANIHRGHLRLTIEDNGKGMPDEELARLFDPFYTGRPGGMGLGLTAARSILNSHGVHVDVASRVGQGTVFTLVFPARPASPPEPGR